MSIATARAAQLTRLPTFVYDYENRCPSHRRGGQHWEGQDGVADHMSASVASALSDSLSVCGSSRYIDTRRNSPDKFGTPARGGCHCQGSSERRVQEQMSPRNTSGAESTLLESPVLRTEISMTSASWSLSKSLKDVKSELASLSGEPALGTEPSLPNRRFTAAGASRSNPNSSRDPPPSFFQHLKSADRPPTSRLEVASQLQSFNSIYAINDSDHVGHGRSSLQNWVGCSPASSSRTSPRAPIRTCPLAMPSEPIARGGIALRHEVESNGHRTTFGNCQSVVLPDAYNARGEKIVSVAGPVVHAVTSSSRNSLLMCNSQTSVTGTLAHDVPVKVPSASSPRGAAASVCSLSPESSVSVQHLHHNHTALGSDATGIRDSCRAGPQSLYGLRPISPVRSLSPQSCTSTRNRKYVAEEYPQQSLSINALAHVTCTSQNLPVQSEGDICGKAWEAKASCGLHEQSLTSPVHSLSPPSCNSASHSRQFADIFPDGPNMSPSTPATITHETRSSQDFSDDHKGKRSNSPISHLSPQNFDSPEQSRQVADSSPQRNPFIFPPILLGTTESQDFLDCSEHDKSQSTVIIRSNALHTESEQSLCLHGQSSKPRITSSSPCSRDHANDLRPFAADAPARFQSAPLFLPESHASQTLTDHDDPEPMGSLFTPDMAEGCGQPQEVHDEDTPPRVGSLRTPGIAHDEDTPPRTGLPDTPDPVSPTSAFDIAMSFPCLDDIHEATLPSIGVEAHNDETDDAQCSLACPGSPGTCLTSPTCSQTVDDLIPLTSPTHHRPQPPEHVVGSLKDVLVATLPADQHHETCWELLERLDFLEGQSPTDDWAAAPHRRDHLSSPKSSEETGMFSSKPRSAEATGPGIRSMVSLPKGRLRASALEDQTGLASPVSLVARRGSSPGQLLESLSRAASHQSSSVVLGERSRLSVPMSRTASHQSVDATIGERLAGQLCGPSCSSDLSPSADAASNGEVPTNWLHHLPDTAAQSDSPSSHQKSESPSSHHSSGASSPTASSGDKGSELISQSPPRTPVWEPPISWEPALPLYSPCSTVVQEKPCAASRRPLWNSTSFSREASPTCRTSPLRRSTSSLGASAREAAGGRTPNWAPPASWAPATHFEDPKRDRWQRSPPPRRMQPAACAVNVTVRPCSPDRGTCERSPRSPRARRKNWTVDIDKASGAPLGIEVNSSSLEVESLFGGLIGMWNASNPEEAIAVGDKVLEVNGIREARHILSECQDEEQHMLSIVFSRDQHARRSSMRDGKGVRSRPVSPLISAVTTAPQREQNNSSVENISVNTPVSLPPRHPGANPCPQKPSLCSLSLARGQCPGTEGHYAQLDASAISLMSESLASANGPCKPQQSCLLAAPPLGCPGHFQSPLDVVHAHGQAGARQLAESVIQRISAERMFSEEVDRACRLQAQREVDDFAAKCRSTAPARAPDLCKGNHSERSICTDARARGQVLSDSVTKGGHDRPHTRVSRMTCSDFLSVQSTTLSAGTSSEVARGNAPAARSALATGHSEGDEPISISDRDASLESWAELPLPSSASPPRKKNKLSPASRDGSPFALHPRRNGPLVVQPHPRQYLAWSRSRNSSMMSDPAAAVAAFDSLQTWAKAGAVEGFAALIQAAMQTHHMISKVRGLRKAKREARKEERDMTLCQEQLRQQLAHQCWEEKRKTRDLREQVDALRMEVESLRHKVPRNVVEQAIRRSPRLPIAARTAEQPQCFIVQADSASLPEIKALREAQSLLSEITLKVVEKLPTRLDDTDTGELKDSLTRRNTSVELPDVQPRRGLSRGPSWASELQPLGTPSNANQCKDEEGNDETMVALDTATSDLHSGREKARSSLLLDQVEEEGSYSNHTSDELFHFESQSTSLERLRSYLRTTVGGEQDGFHVHRSIQNPPTTSVAASAFFGLAHPKPQRSHTCDSKTSLGTCVSTAPNVSLKPELLELLVANLVALPKLLSSNAPEQVVQRIAEVKKRKNCDGFVLLDAKLLTPPEQARILRDGVAVGAVDPSQLAQYMGKEQCGQLREAFCAQWVAGWLGPYLEARRDKLGDAPGEVKTSFWSTGMLGRSPAEQHDRQCGRVLIDGMRELFGRAMRLTGVEQEALTRLLEEFAHVLCLQPEIKSRFRHVLSGGAMPKDVESLEHAVFLLTYNALLLNTAMHNPSAKRSQAPTKAQFSEQGRTIAGFHEDFCKKMYDLIKQQPLGL